MKRDVGTWRGMQTVHPHWRALGPPRFPSFPPSRASRELQRWGLPEGLGAARLHFCAHPTTGKGGRSRGGRLWEVGILLCLWINCP